MKIGPPSYSVSLIIIDHYKLNGGPNDLDLMDHWASLPAYANLE